MQPAPLSSQIFVVVDTETTGLRPADSRIIEIAAVKVIDGKLGERFSQLINPERSVPARITRITGISTRMLFNQPTIQEVWPAFIDFLGDGVLVAHNLNFDLGMIQAEASRLGQDRLENTGICTLRLARRLLRGLRSKALHSVSEFLGIRIKNRHRALGDAEATAEILVRFLERLHFEYGLESLADLVRFQNQSYAALTRAQQHLGRIRTQTLPQLPVAPGVYLMKDARGKVLYVGKAKDLRQRVKTYFNAIEAHPPRLRRLVEQVREVSWEVTATELDALVLESRKIKALLPRFNRVGLRHRSRPFLRLDFNEPFPFFSVTPFVVTDGASYYGPLANRGQAAALLDLIRRFFDLKPCTHPQREVDDPCLRTESGNCSGPCGPIDQDSYRRELDRAVAFLTGYSEEVEAFLDASMQDAAKDLAFEQAASFRDLLDMVQRSSGLKRGVAPSVLDQHVLLIAEQKTAILVIRFGRLVHSLRVTAPLLDSDGRSIEEAIKTYFDSKMEVPDRYLKAQAEEIRLLAHWIYVNEKDIQAVFWTPDLSTEVFFQQVMHVLVDNESEAE